jgi:hypothetical protein
MGKAYLLIRYKEDISYYLLFPYSVLDNILITCSGIVAIALKVAYQKL